MALAEPAEPPRGPDDRALLERLRSGDEAAAASLVREHGGRMLAVAMRLLRSEEDARDAVQEAFISAFRNIHRFEGNSLISTWLHRIVVNAALMKLRSRRRTPEESLEGLLPTFDDTGHEVRPATEWEDSGEAHVHRGERRAMVRRCIDRLPDTFRTVLLMRDIEEMDTAETARLLGVTENAVKIRLHRARQALRTLLDRELNPGSAEA